eukprot:3013927-Lingulodinium_polyedra.AAC.1
MRSAENPADRPSRALLAGAARPRGGPVLVLHLFSGPDRAGDLQDQLARLAASVPGGVQCVSLDL